MLQNHFIEPLYAHLAAKKLGLTVFSEQEILNVEFRDDIEEGDYFLQHRRPGWNGSRAPSYSDEEIQRMPPVLRDNDLTSHYIGAEPGRSNATKDGFRIFRVTNLRAANEHRVFLEAESLYSRPRNWSFRARGASYAAGWPDVWSCEPGRKEKRVTFRPVGRYQWHTRPHYGVIGKFDTEVISQYLGDDGVENREFYSLFRALISNEPARPSVVKAMEKAKQEIDFEELS